MTLFSAQAAADIRNEILRYLSPNKIERLHSQFSLVPLVSGQVLHDRANRIESVFFIECGLASLTADTCDGAEVEVGMIGREGLIGVPALLNPDATAAHRSVIQVPGAAHRVSAAALRRLFEHSPGLRDQCMHFVQMLMVQTAQTAACNARHTAVERLARWLLMARDRLDGDELPLKHEFLADMLGLRRAGVTLAAGMLQASGLITQSRGRIIIRDRRKLEAASCGCYRVIREQSAQISRTYA